MHTNCHEIPIFRQHGLVLTTIKRRKTATDMNTRTLKRKPRPATLRVGGASEIPSVLRSFREDPGEVLTEAGINPDLFDDPGNLITYAARDRLFEHCVAKTGCQHFGLLVGQRMGLQSLGLVGALMKCSTNAGKALRNLVDSLHLHSQGAVMTLEIDHDLAVLTYDSLDPGLEATDQTGDGAVAMMLNVMRELCGSDFEPAEASFAHRRPADIAPYRKFFSVPVYFDTKQYALMFSPKWLGARPPNADKQLQQLLQKHIDTFKAKHSLAFPEQVRSVLRSALMAGHCSEEQIASLFSMRSRTLSRRLNAFGTSHRELVDECRFEIAQQMLKNTSLDVAHIATSLGYSRASAFIRAFRRWSGTTPAVWRASNREVH